MVGDGIGGIVLVDRIDQGEIGLKLFKALKHKRHHV